MDDRRKPRDLLTRKKNPWRLGGVDEFFQRDPPPARITRWAACLRPPNASPAFSVTNTWDFENRMTQTTTGTYGATMAYDPFGRRIYKLWPTGTPFYYVYDGANMVAEIRNTGVTITDFVQGQGIDQPLAQDRNGGKYYMEADGLGSITSMTGTTGAPTNTYIYNSFGVLLTTTGNTADNFNRYTAREADISTTTNWYYYRARYYDPQSGRFLGEDPTGFDAGENFYRYADNDPIDLEDPLGLSPAGPRKRRPGEQQWLECNEEEFTECEQMCAAEGKEFESCRVSSTWRVVGLDKDSPKFDWVKGPLSCSCKDQPAVPTCREIRDKDWIPEDYQKHNSCDTCKLPCGMRGLPGVPNPCPI